MAKPLQSNIVSSSGTQGHVLTSTGSGQPTWTAIADPVIVRYTEKDLTRILRANDGEIRMGVFKAYAGLLKQMIPSLCRGDISKLEDRQHKDIEHFAAVLAATWDREFNELLDARVYGDGTFELLTKVT